MSTNADLATLATASVSAYIDACGALVTPTLDGLLEVEGANADWKLEGYAWDEVKAALVDAWNARA